MYFYIRYFFIYSYIYIFKYRVSKNILSVRCVSRSGYSVAIAASLKTIFARCGVAYSSCSAALSLSLSFLFSLRLFLFFSLSLFTPGSPGSRRGPSEGPRNLEAIRAVQVFEPHTSIPRPGERHLLFWDWAVRNYLPYASPTGPRARRCNQNEWFENSITLITSIKVSIRRGRSFLHSSACLFLSLFLGSRHTKVTFAGRLGDRHHAIFSHVLLDRSRLLVA